MLVNNLLHPKTFTSRYTNHGRKYEPVALKQYQKYMNSNRRPVKVFKSGLVVGIDAPYLGGDLLMARSLTPTGQTLLVSQKLSVH